MALQSVDYTVKLRQASRLLLIEALDRLLSYLLQNIQINIKSKQDARNIQKATQREN